MALSLCNYRWVRVMTWNLWWKFGPWEQRQQPILDELRRVDADVVSLQEVWSDETTDQATFLADELGLELVRSHSEDGSAQTFGNAILSKFPIRLLEQVRLPDLDGKPTARTALIALIEAEPAPRLLINTHLGWQYYDSALRQRQLQAVVEAADRHRHPPGELADGSDDNDVARPIILTGDLNGQPETQELRRLTGLEPGYHNGLIFIDSWAAVGDGPGFTWTRENPNAAEASWPRRRLDYVLVSWPRNKPFCSPLSAELAGTGDGSTVVPSDHYAVVVELDDRLQSNPVG